MGLNLLGVFRVLLTFGLDCALRGDGEIADGQERRLADSDRMGVDRPGGDSGERGEGDADFDVTKRKAGLFEGERESERRSCLIAEEVSTL